MNKSFANIGIFCIHLRSANTVSNMSNLIIAVDGHSSTGKGTFAKEIASRLRVPYLDSGALYRTVTLYALEKGIIEWNGCIQDKQLNEAIMMGDIDISLVSLGGRDRIFLGDEDVTSRIRDLDVARNVSAVSAIPFVRNFVDEQLHRLGGRGCVMDGRDIGTAVFPNADLKIFMTADPETRARRRLKQMEESGQKASFEDILQNVLDRDYLDSHRKMNPLRKADDAILLDNSEMTVEQEIEWLDGILRERFGIGVL